MKKPQPLKPEQLSAFTSKIGMMSQPSEEGVGDKTRYLKNACTALSVPYTKNEDRIYHHVGSFDISSSTEAINATVETYHALRNPRNFIFTYEEYLDAYKRRGSIQGRIEAIARHREQEEVRYQEYQARYSAWSEKDSEKRGPAPQYHERPEPDPPSERDLVFVEYFDFNRYKQNEEGYLSYLLDVAPDLYNIIIEPVPLYLEEELNRPHGYILGTPGSGKSELLKLLIHTYVTQPKYGSVVVIDPTSDFTGQIARWKEFNTSNRLIYFRPTLAKGLTPVINPFEISGVNATDYSEKALNVKRVIAQELAEALGRIVSEGGGFITGPMRTILTNCILVLLDKESSTLRDLSKFVKDDHELVTFGKSLKHHEYISEYFETGFNVKTNNATKEAIGRRLDDLLSVGTFLRCTCGKSTFDLEKAVNERKVILFDLGKGAIGKREGAALGRLVIAMLTGLAFRREGERVPCQIVIDECHNFVTQSMADILTEARKYRLFLTMAQQIAGQHLSPDLKDIVLETTNLQAVGGTSASGAKRNADIVGVQPEDVRKLDIGEFYVRAHRSGSPIKFRTRTDLLDWKNCVAKETWHRVLEEQTSQYYTQYDSSVKKIVYEEEVDTDPQVW